VLRRLLLSAGLIGLSASAALTADMGVPPPSYVPVAIPPLYYDWTGFYLGGNAGGAWAFSNGATSAYLPTGAVEQEFTSRSYWGFAGGGQVGYNWFFSPNFVVGAEGDFDALSNRTTLTNLAVTASQTDHPEWVSTLRARVGLTADRWMWYGTGGVAWSSEDITRTQLVASPTTSSAPASTVETLTHTSVGFAVGTGLEYALLANVTARLEFLYVGLDTQSYTFPVSQTRTTATFDSIGIVRFGLNYKFGGGNIVTPISTRD
jgi:outer membrane immunogenic protein